MTSETYRKSKKRKVDSRKFICWLLIIVMTGSMIIGPVLSMLF